MKRVLIGFVVVALVAVAAAYGWRWHLISELRKPILAELNDPDSAVFRDEIVITPWDSSDAMYCGEINTKNRMGGYVGYKSFYVISGNSYRSEPLFFLDRNLCISYLLDASWWWMRW